MARVPRTASDLTHWFSRETGWTDAVLPDYQGGSIANLPGSVLNAFGVSNLHEMLPALRPDILDADFLDRARVVVLLVVDGLALESLASAVAHGVTDYLDTAQHSSAMTSVFPSTTAAALTTLQTGVSPAKHGMAGYTLFLAEQQATVNMITWKPVGGVEMEVPLPEPRDFLPVRNVYARLEDAGIESSIVSNLAFMDSALTNVQSAGVPYRGHRTPAEFAGLLLREARMPGRRFIFGYWDGVDALSHTYGPESNLAQDEIHLLDRALGRGLFEPLAKQGSDVVVLLTSDHGHTSLVRSRTRSLREMIRRYGAARPIPTGERRAVGLPFDDAAGVDALRSFAGDDGVVLDAQSAIEAGLYGPGGSTDLLLDRIGKTLLLAKNDAAFVFPQSSNPTRGGHGSLTSREMIVPLLGWRF